MRQGQQGNWAPDPNASAYQGQPQGGFGGFDGSAGGGAGGMPQGMPGAMGMGGMPGAMGGMAGMMPGAPGMMMMGGMPGMMPGSMGMMPPGMAGMAAPPGMPGAGMPGMGGMPGAMAAGFPPQNQQQGQQQRRQRPTGPDGQPVTRNNEIGDPSPVVHLRNVTPEVSQLSIQNLVQSFGRVKSIVMLRQKNQALVAMETIESAKQIVEYFKDPGYSEIDGRRVYIRYSAHMELTATQRTSKALLVSMFNTQYDVSAAAQITPMIVYQIFSTYGPIEKIVVLPKNDSSAQNYNRVQALVQFETLDNAEEVKNMLQGQPVILGKTITFTMDIQFSRMDEIKTSSPHNSLVVPKGGQPQPPLPNQQQGQQGFNSQEQQQQQGSVLEQPQQ